MKPSCTENNLEIRGNVHHSPVKMALVKLSVSFYEALGIFLVQSDCGNSSSFFRSKPYNTQPLDFQTNFAKSTIGWQNLKINGV